MVDQLYGREVLESECVNLDFDKLVESDRIETSGFISKKGQEYCRRCNTKITPIEFNDCFCGQPCTYCTNCLQMGKIRRCSRFFHIPEPNRFEIPKDPVLTWKGTLSNQQREASEEIIQSIDSSEVRLLWAVAGAGKTEMLFPGIEKAIKAHKRICLASPRVDVCLELAPRIQEAFPNVSMSVLYGGMEEVYTYTQLVVATTHQLYRFKEAFDLLIIDEIDAFPFRLDDALHFAVDKARKQQSALIYLTATPDRSDQKEISQKKLKASILPARYHGHPLPMPIMIREPNWQKRLLKPKQSTKVFKEITKRLDLQKKFLLFLPNIEWMETFKVILQRRFKEARFEAVHSQDEQRKQKVLLMREKKLDFLITTTILERGVTFPDIDVLVIGADDRIFTEASLVQIAGRAGRSPEYPTGDVLYFHDGMTIEMKRAIRQIKKMNTIARKRGLLLT